MPLVLPAREACFTVFSQRPDSRVDVAEWTRHSERFLGTRIALSEQHDREDDGAASMASVVLSPAREKPGTSTTSGTRVCWGRARSEDDLEAARNAVAAGAGLVELAARCPHVWLVKTESGTEDLLALRLAAILAGVVLGPILSPGGAALFGPKTARERLG
jgi:hypothetical protein